MNHMVVVLTSCTVDRHPFALVLEVVVLFESEDRPFVNLTHSI